MKTAIQELYNEIIGDDGILDMPMEFIQKITSKFAKSMDKEKQQIIEAYEKDMDSNGNLSFESGEQYYNEKYTIS